MLQNRPILASAPRLAAALAALSLLAACGQRGPLYLPQSPAAAQRASLPASVLGTGQPPAAESSAATAAPAPASAPTP